MALQEGPLAGRAGSPASPPSQGPTKSAGRAKALFFLFFTGTKSPGTTGNSVNQVTKRKVNTRKAKEDLNPLSSFLKLDKDPANSENHGKP